MFEAFVDVQDNEFFFMKKGFKKPAHKITCFQGHFYFLLMLVYLLNNGREFGSITEQENSVIYPEYNRSDSCIQLRKSEQMHLKRQNCEGASTLQRF